jgi:hypothetical protein
MRNATITAALFVAVLLAGCDIAPGHSHGPDGSHVPKTSEPQKPADHHKSID